MTYRQGGTFYNLTLLGRHHLPADILQLPVLVASDFLIAISWWIAVCLGVSYPPASYAVCASNTCLLLTLFLNRSSTSLLTTLMSTNSASRPSLHAFYEDVSSGFLTTSTRGSSIQVPDSSTMIQFRRYTSLQNLLALRLWCSTSLLVFRGTVCVTSNEHRHTLHKWGGRQQPLRQLTSRYIIVGITR